MYVKGLVLGIYVETPMHPGSGLNINTPVDLPIQREVHTLLPIIQGQTVKGVLRSFADKIWETKKELIEDLIKKWEIKDLIRAIFGPEPEESIEYAGTITVTDARLLAFPARTLKGLFCWITCPQVLDRFKRDLEVIGIQSDLKVPELNKYEALTSSKILLDGEYIYIEDIRIKAKDNDGVRNIAETISDCYLPHMEPYERLREKFKSFLVVISDTLFRDFVNINTEIVARIAINQERGVVKEGALWYEEYIPTDSVFYSLILIPKESRHDKIKLSTEEILRLLKSYDSEVIQIGGNETIGKGLVRLRAYGGYEK
ncbi:MAG: type III-B CRISPR module RAMP protein Cmr4 [Candidatus Asgardarchaeia archaeon]